MNLLPTLTLGTHARTVWIFGAGASAAEPYGVPVQSRLLAHLATVDVPGREKARVARLRSSVERYCRSVQPGIRYDDPRLSIEEVFSAWELVRDERRSTAGQRRDGEKAVEDLREAIRMATEVYGGGNARKYRPHHRDGVGAPYAELLERLFPATDSGLRHVLMTFNYDICLDRCVIHLRGAPRDLDLDYGIPLSNERVVGAPRFASPRAERAVLLLRTHGALNWVRCHACQSVFTTVNRHATVEETSRCWSCGRTRLDHVLVHPSYLRSYADPLIQIVWGRCQEELVQADRWVFVGYSLPAADVHFRELLRDCLRERDHAKKPTAVVAVGRGPTTTAAFAAYAANYQALFDDSRVAFWDATAEGFADFVRCVVP
jgi:hypothetical protein